MQARLPYMLTLLLLAILTLILVGCDGSSSVNRPVPTYSYRFDGVLVKDLNTDYARIAATLSRDDSLVTGAEIRFGGDSLAYCADSTYYRVVLPAGEYPAGSYDIEIRDSSRFHDTLATGLAADFVIETVFPAQREKRTFDLVRLTWSGSADAEGYIIAAVKRDSLYTGGGYSQYVTSQTTYEEFPHDAFNLPNDDPDTGWYNLYVYSYIGSSDSALSAELLPVPMPSQLADNISVNDLTGRFGTIIVTRFDSMRVVVK